MWECVPQVPKDLHPGWKVGHRKKERKKGGQQLTRLWLNTEHTAGPPLLVLQEEGQRERRGSLSSTTLSGKGSPTYDLTPTFNNSMLAPPPTARNLDGQISLNADVAPLK
ncbi:hypothetical protein EYF80_027333 [Liparis tanakae]|uniref:Uncharacterized protein n=1 Tax=Liparis tanakae TaxID=230148 RepID=A0A4Z2HAY7_9TELE|nr:hypothetical protein EYF80_027333 [Liparis tanakae]